jgi:hypothetical protein
MRRVVIAGVGSTVFGRPDTTIVSLGVCAVDMAPIKLK